MLCPALARLFLCAVHHCIAITAIICRTIAAMGNEQDGELRSARHPTKTGWKATPAPKNGIRQTKAG